LVVLLSVTLVVMLATRGRLRNRIAGGMLMGAGAVLAMARRK
jgi:hypothetical protein